MAEKKADAVVTLIAPNGQTVSVAESKKVERLAGGYRLPEKRSSGKTSK